MAEPALARRMSLPPMATVACHTPGCRAAGRPQRIRLTPVGVNLVQVPVVVCTLCGAQVRQEGDGMPKITLHGGASIYTEQVGEPEKNVIDVSPFGKPGTEFIPAEPEGGEQSSPGSSSETSSERQPRGPEKSETAPQSHAPTTESPSTPPPTGGSSARSTDGGPRVAATPPPRRRTGRTPRGG